jgi:hypothetical protein
MSTLICCVVYNYYSVCCCCLQKIKSHCSRSCLFTRLSRKLCRVSDQALMHCNNFMIISSSYSLYILMLLISTYKSNSPRFFDIVCTYRCNPLSHENVTTDSQRLHTHIQRYPHVLILPHFLLTRAIHINKFINTRRAGG